MGAPAPHVLCGAVVVDRDEPGATVRRGEVVEEQPWRPRVGRAIGRGAGPVEVGLGVEPGVAQPAVVRAASRARSGELVEDQRGVGVPGAGGAEPGGELAPDPQLGPGASRCVDGPAATQDPSFERGHRALLLGPLRARAGRRRRAARSRTGRRRRRRAGRARRGGHRRGSRSARTPGRWPRGRAARADRPHARASRAARRRACPCRG